jgi:predicted outer membrane protein
VAIAVLTVGFTGRSFGQKTDPATRPDDRATEVREAPDRAGLTQPSSHADQMVANQAFEMSKGEIELANFALKHTQNEEVRKFAQMMIEDHTNFNNQLAKFASPELARNATDETSAAGGRSDPAAPPKEAAAPGTSSEQNPADRSTESAVGNPAVQIFEDISRQIGSSIEKELGQYQGSDFDRAYVGQQFWGHVVFVASTRGAEKHVSKDLQQVLDQGATTAEKHLDHCRKLIRDLSSNVARGNETTPRR